MKETKRMTYARHGIEYRKGKILAPSGAWIAPFLKAGNVKTGRKVYTFSTLPTSGKYETEFGKIRGTCPVTCSGCYATKGCYNFPGVVRCLAINTIMVRQYRDFVRRAIIAQLETLPGCNEIRIFAAGDFCISADHAVNVEYVEMWRDIIRAVPGKFFWTYTKCREFENAFDDLPNANIVKSVINGIGFNFGKVEYIIAAYRKLKAAGLDVYICRCGIDPGQHCHNCHSCSKHAFVLFLEHSTGYKPETSPAYMDLVAIVNAQENENEIAA